MSDRALFWRWTRLDASRTGLWAACLFGLTFVLACQSTPPVDEEGSQSAAVVSPDEEQPELPFPESVAKWREEREARLLADDGWLTVDGLYWLKEGENRFGGASDNDIVLPEENTPDYAGVFTYADGKVSVKMNGGIVAEFQDAPLGGELTPLEIGEKHAISLGDLSFWVHFSGERKCIRLRNPNSELRKNFEGLDWYPIEDKYRVSATLVPYDEPRTVKVPNVFGDLETYTSPGELAFTLDGEAHSLQAFETSRGFFLVISDATSGKTTYPSARFVGTAKPVDGEVELDFNKAYNPPCALNPHTTCPLPPPENRMKIALNAGEKYSGHHDTTDE